MEYEKIQALYRFLQGKLPDGWVIERPLKLSPKEAGAVIYFLQEYCGLISEQYEQCSECDEIFDSWSEGIKCDTGIACECCRPLYSFCNECEEYFKKSDLPENTFFVLNTDDAKDQGMLPGLYKAKKFPMYVNNIISDTIYRDAVELIKESKEYKSTGYICTSCATVNKQQITT